MALREFEIGEFIIVYKGELVALSSAKLQEKKYADHPDIGSYMYFFKYKEATFWLVHIHIYIY